uniref:Mitochondrial intermembrane space import and assembly protein 40 homolog n=1 Tax=Ananas comosus var. bracteatus TaxID=296719 RepID=A0A6V7QN42_ANACO|nr:unnamed protein product [Ananas comosus var. bracteatus]
MGQAQSFTAADNRQISPPPPPPPTTTTTTVEPPPPPPSMEALVSEAMAFGEDGSEESLDAKVQKALECPCVAGLRSGPCGAQFTEAFACFLRSTAEEQGSDCVSPFIALQNCIKANPNAFSKDVLDEEEEDNESGQEDKKMSNYRIKAPSWSRETRSKM